jgi:hypothetical protein
LTSDTGNYHGNAGGDKSSAKENMKLSGAAYSIETYSFSVFTSEANTQ